MSLELTPAEKEFSFNSLVGAFEGDSVGMSNGMSFWIGGQQDAPSDLYIIYEADLATGRKRQLTTGKHAERTKHDSW